MFNVQQQSLYLARLALGSSPQMICRELELEVTDLFETLDECPDFAVQVDRIHEMHSQNVATALYRQALEGNVSAQTFYLKNSPPPEWQPQEAITSEMVEYNLETYFELLRLAEQARVDLPPEARQMLKERCAAAFDSETLSGTIEADI